MTLPGLSGKTVSVLMTAMVRWGGGLPTTRSILSRLAAEIHGWKKCFHHPNSPRHEAEH